MWFKAVCLSGFGRTQDKLKHFGPGLATGIEWKNGRKLKMGKNSPKQRKWPTARNGGQNGPKKVEKIENDPKSHFFAIFGPFFPHFGLWAIFFSIIFGPFFPIFSAFGPFSILLQASSARVQHTICTADLDARTPKRVKVCVCVCAYAWFISTLFLQNWGFYEFTFLRDGPYFFKVNAL